MRAPCHAAQLALGAFCGLGTLFLTACSSPGTTAAPASTMTVTVTASPTATSPPASPGPLPCRAADVHLAVGAGNGAAGTIYYPLNFTDVSDSACTMYGYPGAAFVSSPHGSQIGAPAGRRHDAARTLVTLAPGATAHATLAVSDVLIGNNCRHRRVPVNWIQVYPPGQFSALYAPLHLLACADPGLVTMTVTPVSGGQ